MQTSFIPAWWLKNPHLQTLWASLMPRNLPGKVRFERIELLDGDFLDLTWVGDKTPDAPLVLILHGLNGSLRSTYVQGILQTIVAHKWRGVLMHFRGCSGEINRLAKSYHAGETGDLDYVVKEIVHREPQTPLFIVGYSLGGNVLLKWLGEDTCYKPVQAAVAVSVPFELNKSVERLNRGFSKLYQQYLIQGLISFHRQKFTQMSQPFDFGEIDKLQNFWDFDNAITAPLHGFKSAEDYYNQSSSRQYLANIQIPTLILQAKDDPFTTLNAIPTPEEMSSTVSLEVTEQGGHVGFVSGVYPWRPVYWLDQRILHFLKNH